MGDVISAPITIITKEISAPVTSTGENLSSDVIVDPVIVDSQITVEPKEISAPVTKSSIVISAPINVGLPGPIGPQGEQGVDGPQGIQGIPGVDGIDGQSAYEIAVINGFVGSESEWLNSLSAKSGFIFVTDVTSSGNVSKTYVSNTVPENSVVESAITDNDLVTISILCEGSVNWSPTVTIDGISCTLTQDQYDIRTFSGSVDVTVSTTRTIEIVSSTGRETSITINRAVAGPDVLTAVIGDYPGTQTAAKLNDQILITGTLDSEATHIRLVEADAFSSLIGEDVSGWVSVTGGIFSVTGVISNNNGNQSATFEAKNILGTIGTQKTSNIIVLDQSSPTIETSTINYPVGQAAFKGTESGSVTTNVLDYTSILYSSPNGDFIPNNSTVYENTKNITCTNPGDYKDSVTNFRITAYKSSNNTTTISNVQIEVADVAPLITISQPYTRLRSGGNDGTSVQDYTISATSNQNLSDAPDIVVGVSGTWQGTSFSGSGKNWTRTLRIADNDDKGTGDWSFGTISTNNAGIPGTIAGTQNNGGYVSRNITLAAFANEALMNVESVDYTKVNMSWSVKSLPNKRAVGTTSTPDQDSWCLDSLSPSPVIIRILDTAATDASSQASTITIEEIV